MTKDDRPQVGVFVGRLCPPHLGHSKIIQTMIDDFGVDNCMVLIGSSATKIQYRVLFGYYDRVRWVRRLFKDIKIIGIPDVPDNDGVWFGMLDDYINAVFPGKCPIFYGGSTEDIKWYYEHSCKVKVVDRNQLPISATNVRQLMLLGESIDTVVDKRIAKEVWEIFQKQMKKLEDLKP